ncbi:MAG: 16S rRNA (cytidine(1402)-2'-O)-methyltransferase [Gammaproteobacteria bacterium]|nr:MAG: 16S rRNA (cytidine(1402)-2'-O)-methyltransferase [Gammaproteobacteria bacterium]
MSSSPGCLYLVPTPIGNLHDWSQRAIEVVKKVDLLAVEDTRRAKQLLANFALDKPMLSLHEHNERERAPRIIARCQQGEQVALMSDAGTPLVSDPGFYLVRCAHEAKIPVVPIPGPCAAIVALSASGLPSDRFVFEGFLPAKKHARQARLEALATEPRTLIFYESTHRIVDMLTDAQHVFGTERVCAIAKELTKCHETIWRGRLAEAVDWLTAVPERRRGEFVVLVEGVDKSPPSLHMTPEMLAKRLAAHLSPSQAAQIAAELTGEKKRTLYRCLMDNKPFDEDLP